MDKAPFLFSDEPEMSVVDSTEIVDDDDPADNRGTLLESVRNYIYGQASLSDTLANLDEVVLSNTDRRDLFDILQLFDNANYPDDKVQRLRDLYDNCHQLLPELFVRFGIQSANDQKATSTLLKVKTNVFFKDERVILLTESNNFATIKTIVELNHGNILLADQVAATLKMIVVESGENVKRVLSIILGLFLVNVKKYKFYVALLKSLNFNAQQITDSLIFSKRTDLISAPDELASNIDLNFQTALDGLLEASEQTDVTENEMDKLDDVDLETLMDATSDSRRGLAKMIVHLYCNNLVDLSAVIRQIYADQLNEVDDEMAARLQMVNACGRPEEPAFANTHDDQKMPATDQLDDTLDIGNNQLLKLIYGFVAVGNWKATQVVNNFLPENYATCYYDICEVINQIVSFLISPVYDSVCLSKLLRQSSPVPVKSQRYPGLRRKQCKTLRNFVQIVIPMLLKCGPSLSLDPILLTKVIRLCAAVSQEELKGNEGVQDCALPLMDVCIFTLFPAVSAMESSQVHWQEVYTLLSAYPDKTRYEIYRGWMEPSRRAHPWVKRKERQTIASLRYAMKRLSKENVKDMGRLIGNLCTTLPIVTLDNVLTEVQRFDNLVGPVVESLNNLTTFGYDALTFCILLRLSRPDEEMLKMADGTIASWLQTLATFVGSLCSVYPMNVDCLLCHINGQVLSGNSAVLVILQEIVKSTSSVVVNSGMTTEADMQIVFGGDSLMIEHNLIKCDKGIRASILRLEESLLKNRRAYYLLCAMAARRKSILDDESEYNVKAARVLYDQCTDAMVQLATFVYLFVDPQSYAKLIPSANELFSTFNLDYDIAIFFTRPLYTYMIMNKYEHILEDIEESLPLDMKVKINAYVEAFYFTLLPFMEHIVTEIPHEAFDHMSPNFFTFFWMMSCGDICVSDKAYHDTIEEISRPKVFADHNFPSKISSVDADAIDQLVKKLTKEMKYQIERYHLNQMFLELEKRFHVDTSIERRIGFVNSFLAFCIGQRCVLSDIDSVFCSLFWETLHFAKNVNFPTLLFLHALFIDVAPFIAGHSELEAARFGRFLSSCLEMITRWHFDQKQFVKDCSNHPGFVIPIQFEPNCSMGEEYVVSYSAYRGITHLWHCALYESLKKLLASNSFTSQRNALIVLKQILPSFPILKIIGQHVKDKVYAIERREKNLRPDLSLLASSYMGHLKHTEKLWMDDAAYLNFDQPRSTSPSKVVRSSDGRLCDDEDKKFSSDIGNSRTQHSSKLIVEQRSSSSRVRSFTERQRCSPALPSQKEECKDDLDEKRPKAKIASKEKEATDKSKKVEDRQSVAPVSNDLKEDQSTKALSSITTSSAEEVSGAPMAPLQSSNDCTPLLVEKISELVEIPTAANSTENGQSSLKTSARPVESSVCKKRSRSKSIDFNSGSPSKSRKLTKADTASGRRLHCEQTAKSKSPSSSASPSLTAVIDEREPIRISDDDASSDQKEKGEPEEIGPSEQKIERVE